MIVYKYPLIFHGLTGVQLPADAKLLYVGLDPNNVSCLWALLDPTMPHITRTIQLLDTGTPLPDHARYISTFIADWAVIHAFEVTQ